jgi:hypothetical protein
LYAFLNDHGVTKESQQHSMMLKTIDSVLRALFVQKRVQVWPSVCANVRKIRKNMGWFGSILRG